MEAESGVCCAVDAVITILQASSVVISAFVLIRVFRRSREVAALEVRRVWTSLAKAQTIWEERGWPVHWPGCR